MHDHGGLASGMFVPGVLLALLVLATVLHLRARSTGDSPEGAGHALGHALMAVGMASMLVPAGWQPIPVVTWQVVFCLSGAYFLTRMVLRWRDGARAAALWHAELAIGDAAMVYMLGPAWLAWSPLTALLAAYFGVHALLAGGLFLGRCVAIELPEQALGSRPAEPQPKRKMALSARSVPTALAAAHCAMATAMVYMLARVP